MEQRLLRLKQIIGDASANPPITPLIPISASGWWSGIRQGIYPKPLKLSKRVTVWRLQDIQKLLER